MRTPKPFYRKQNQSWYPQLGKKQINLGRDKTKAMAKYHKLMANREEAMAEDPCDLLPYNCTSS